MVLELADTSHDYVVVLKGASALKFKPGDFLRVSQFPSVTGPLNVVFQTRYVDEGHAVAIPREIWIDVRGKASSIQEAIQVLANAAGSLLPVLVVSANAAVGGIDVELVYDNTPGISKREYFQQFLPSERGMPYVGRSLNLDATLAILRILSTHPEHERLHRAMSQYRDALANWELGRETLALAHLYMGMEAITKVAVRHLCRVHDVNEEGLMAQLMVKEQRALEAVVRRTFLFRGDEDCHRKAKEASDGFEHGFLPLNIIHDKASLVRGKTAAYLRKAIFELLELDDATQSLLQTAPFDRPLACSRIARYLKGHLLGETDSLSAENQEYPIMQWHWKIRTVSINEDGRYGYSIDQTIEPRLADGVTFQPDKIEVWGP